MQHSLGDICDFKDAGGETYYRYSEEKAMLYLEGKVAKLMSAFKSLGAATGPGTNAASAFALLDDEGLKAYAVGYLQEYLPKELICKLRTAMNVPEPGKAPPASAKPKVAQARHVPEKRPFSFQSSKPAAAAQAKKKSKLSLASKNSMKISSFFMKR